MKRQKRLIWTIAALIAILALGTTSVAAKATKTSFSGEIWLLRVVAFPPLTLPGGNRHVRGLEVEDRMVVPDNPDVTGNGKVVINCNLDANGVGPCWGTFRWETDAGQGFWEGSYNGYGYADGSQVTYCVGHGGGAFEGQQIKWTSEYEKNMVLFPDTVGLVTGRILDPHGE